MLVYDNGRLHRSVEQLHQDLESCGAMKAELGQLRKSHKTLEAKYAKVCVAVIVITVSVVIIVSIIIIDTIVVVIIIFIIIIILSSLSSSSSPPPTPFLARLSPCAGLAISLVIQYFLSKDLCNVFRQLVFLRVFLYVVPPSLFHHQHHNHQCVQFWQLIYIMNKTLPNDLF